MNTLENLRCVDWCDGPLVWAGTDETGRAVLAVALSEVHGPDAFAAVVLSDNRLAQALTGQADLRDAMSRAGRHEYWEFDLIDGRPTNVERVPGPIGPAVLPLPGFRLSLTDPQKGCFGQPPVPGQ